MAVNIEDVLLLSLAQRGDKYVFGAKASKKVVNPDKFDCSGLVTWACERAGLTMPNGAFAQWKHTRRSDLTVATGMRMRGALLFVGDGTGQGRDAITHVAWSLGDGTTIEARGKKWGVGCCPSVKRFDFAAKVPGASYGKAKVAPVKQTAGRPVIKRGSTGPYVAYLQTVLRKRDLKGKNGKLLPVTGKFAENTEFIVKAIQLWYRVEDDGEVGPITWAIIDQLARA